MTEIYTYNTAYLARFNSDGHETYLNNYFLPTLEHLLGSKAEGNVAIEVDDDLTEVVIFFIHDYQVQGLIELLKSERLVINHRDITDELLMSQEMEPIVHKMIQSDEFSSKFSDFIENNLTIDTVLDKINRLGFKSLTEADKELLNSSK